MRVIYKAAASEAISPTRTNCVTDVEVENGGLPNLGYSEISSVLENVKC